MSENLIIFNARIVTPTGISARKGAEMRQLRIIENGTVEVTKGIITYVGESRGEDRDGYYQHYRSEEHTSDSSHTQKSRMPSSA